MTARFVTLQLAASGREVAFNVDAVDRVEAGNKESSTAVYGRTSEFEYEGSSTSGSGRVRVWRYEVKGTLDEVVRKLNGTPATPPVRKVEPFPGESLTSAALRAGVVSPPVPVTVVRS